MSHPAGGENTGQSHTDQQETDEALRQKAREAGIPDVWAEDFLNRNDDDEHRLIEGYRSNNFVDEDTGQRNRPGGSPNANEGLRKIVSESGAVTRVPVGGSGAGNAMPPYLRLAPVSTPVSSSLFELMLKGLLPASREAAPSPFLPGSQYPPAPPPSPPPSPPASGDPYWERGTIWYGNPRPGRM